MGPMKFTHRAAIGPVLMLSSLTLLAGCGGNAASPTTWYPISSIYAYMRAVQDASGNVTTTVQLRNGPTGAASYLYLDGGDMLYSSLDTSPQQFISFNGNLFGNSIELSQRLKAMSSRDLYADYGVFTNVISGKPEYFSVDTPDASSSPTRAYVGFDRNGQVLESFVELPPAFQISSPASGASISRATPVTLSWTNVDPASTVELDVAGACTDNSRYNLHLILGADTGSATLNSADYYQGSASINCQVAFMLQRVRPGTISPQFAFGSITGVQQRTVQFTSTP